LSNKLSKLDSEGIIEVLNKVNTKILEENKDLRVEMNLIKLYRLIMNKTDPDEVITFATECITSDIKCLVDNIDND
jgi:hypothetical protein